MPTAESPFKLRSLLSVFGLAVSGPIGTAKKVAEPLTPSGNRPRRAVPNQFDPLL